MYKHGRLVINDSDASRSRNFFSGGDRVRVLAADHLYRTIIRKTFERQSNAPFYLKLEKYEHRSIPEQTFPAYSDTVITEKMDIVLLLSGKILSQKPHILGGYATITSPWPVSKLEHDTKLARLSSENCIIGLTPPRDFEESFVSYSEQVTPVHE